MPDNYRRDDVQRVLDAGPNDDEDFFRLEVHGTKSTKRLSLSAAELSTIRDFLHAADNPDSVKLPEAGASGDRPVSDAVAWLRQRVRDSLSAAWDDVPVGVGAAVIHGLSASDAAGVLRRWLREDVPDADPDPVKSTIGRADFLMEKLAKVLLKEAKRHHDYGPLRRAESLRGYSFDVRIRVGEEAVRHIARVTVELDRVLNEDDEPATDSVKTWTYSQLNQGGADITHGITFEGTDQEWAEHLAGLTFQGIEPYNAKITAPVTVLGDDFPATPEGFAAAQAEADRMADLENARIAAESRAGTREGE